MKKLLITTALIFTAGAVQAQDIKMEKIGEEMVKQYYKGWMDPVLEHHVTSDIKEQLGISDQLDIGLKSSRYRFEDGSSIKFKTQDPMAGLEYSDDNRHLRITQDSLGFSLSRTLNQEAHDRPDLEKFID